MIQADPITPCPGQRGRELRLIQDPTGKFLMACGKEGHAWQCDAWLRIIDTLGAGTIRGAGAQHLTWVNPTHLRRW